MAITSIVQQRQEGRTAVHATSDLPGSVYFHWYRDGTYVGMTRSNVQVFALRDGQRARIAVIDTDDPAFDPEASPPCQPGAFQLLQWRRSLDANVAYYCVSQQKDGADWETIGTVEHEQEADPWSYSYVAGPLDDLSIYSWRVTPVDTDGKEGTPKDFVATKIVRVPDAPRFVVAYNEETAKVTFSEVSG